MDSEAEAAIARAEQAMEAFGRKFCKFALEEMDVIDQALSITRKNPDAREEKFRTIFHRAMDLQGQGESFGYPLITEIGASLMAFTEGRDHADPRVVEIISAHVNAMRSVLTNEISGDGGEIGREIIAGLLKLTASR